MQCDDIEVQLPPPSRACLNELDNALNELGMLASRTKSRDDYLNEIQNKKYLNMLTINTRYVSNVSIGFRVRPVAPHVRYKPYKMPKERHRTRSENNDNDTTTSWTASGIVDDCVEKASLAVEDLSQLKKAKSLESIIAEGTQTVDLSNVSLDCKDLDVVSNSIQNLKVDE